MLFYYLNTSRLWRTFSFLNITYFFHKKTCFFRFKQATDCSVVLLFRLEVLIKGAKRGYPLLDLEV